MVREEAMDRQRWRDEERVSSVNLSSSHLPSCRLFHFYLSVLLSAYSSHLIHLFFSPMLLIIYPFLHLSLIFLPLFISLSVYRYLHLSLRVSVLSFFCSPCCSSFILLSSIPLLSLHFYLSPSILLSIAP